MQTITKDHIVHSFSSKNQAVAEVCSGERVKFITASPGIPDAVFEKDYSIEPFPKRILSITGPLFVKDTMPGDCLKITIKDIVLEEIGKMWMGQWMGVLSKQVDHCFMKNVPIENGKAIIDENLQLPLRPMIGTIGTTPQGEGVECLVPGSYGGNMDSLSVSVGNILYLPVFVEGALLCVGDVHATMGRGEVFGTGVEIGSEVELEIEVIKQKNLTGPLVENQNSYIVLSSAPTLEQACIDATNRAIDFITESIDCCFDIAYALVGQACDLKIEQIVNPNVTVSIEIPKNILI